MTERFANTVSNPVAVEILEALITIQNSEHYNIRRGSWEFTYMLCNCYNWATSPHEERTGKEHKACARFARYCRKHLEGRPGWREDENGLLRVP